MRDHAAYLSTAIPAGYSLDAIEAAWLYLDRRDRRAHPAGRFDRAGRFDIAAAERCDCCTGIRSPSRAYPYPEMAHARTAEHCAALHRAEPADVRRLARWLDAMPAAPAADATAHAVMAWRADERAWLRTLKPTAPEAARRKAEVAATRAAEREAARAHRALAKAGGLRPVITILPPLAA